MYVFVTTEDRYNPDAKKRQLDIQTNAAEKKKKKMKQK